MDVVQTNSDPSTSTSHTQAITTEPGLSVLPLDSLTHLNLDDDGPGLPNRPETPQISTGDHNPLLEPKVDPVMSHDLSPLSDPPLVDQPQPLVDHLPSEPIGLRRSTRTSRMTSRMRESISQQPSRKCHRIQPSKASSPWIDDGDQPPASTANEYVTDLEEQIMAQPKEDLIETEKDVMGLFRRYTVLPSTDPDQYLTIHHVSDAPTFAKDMDPQLNPFTVFRPQTMQSVESHTSVMTPSFTPFLNHSVSKLMNWFYQRSTKTLADLDSLVHSIILYPDFHSSDFKNFSVMYGRYVSVQ